MICFPIQSGTTRVPGWPLQILGLPIHRPHLLLRLQRGVHNNKASTCWAFRLHPFLGIWNWAWDWYPRDLWATESSNSHPATQSSISHWTSRETDHLWWALRVSIWFSLQQKQICLLISVSLHPAFISTSRVGPHLLSNDIISCSFHLQTSYSQEEMLYKDQSPWVRLNTLCMQTLQSIIHLACRLVNAFGKQTLLLCH